MHWHGHEMIFGYTMAVIAGFLLTAVGNWTGQPGLRGPALLGLVGLWLIARLAYFVPVPATLTVSAAADSLFTLGLIAAVALPVVRVRQWHQLWILVILALLLFSNLYVHMGWQGYAGDGIRQGLYLGLYVVLALIFAIARRVLPFFIERGVGGNFQPVNRRWVDIGSMALFLVWAVTDVFLQQSDWVAALSVGLLVLHGVRLRDWYTPAIVKVPLLWSLYAGYGFLLLGFLLKVLSPWLAIPPTLALHAFAFGGIGLITLSMMSRVSLGHTGRSVFEPPTSVQFMFYLLVLGALARVVAPILSPSHYPVWIATSQSLWILGFMLFAFIYLPMLVRPRIDGKRG